MGIKTGVLSASFRVKRTLKNLPTTWGLKQVYYQLLSE